MVLRPAEAVVLWFLGVNFFSGLVADKGKIVFGSTGNLSHFKVHKIMRHEKVTK